MNMSIIAKHPSLALAWRSAMLRKEFDLSLGTRLPKATAAAARAAGARTPDDRTFICLLDAFRSHGGLAHGDEVAERLRRLRGTDIASLARRIAARELICFEWQGELWLPLLQFDPLDMSLRPALAQVGAELAPAFEAWELCCWLAAPNASLDDRAPLDALPHGSDEVVQAARVDRFILRG